MNLDQLLVRLEEMEILRRVAGADQSYMFKQALTQEAVYQSLLRSERRQLHREIAEATERAFPDGTEERSDVLAYHWERGEAPDRARHYLLQAGRSAARRYANQEALDLFARALSMSDGAPAEEVLAIREARGKLHEFLSQYSQALADYEEALALARQAGRPDDECRIMGRVAWLYWLSGKSPEALATAQQAEKRASALADRSVALRAYLVAGLVAQADGRLSEAYPHMRRALFASRASDERAAEGESLFYLGVQDNFRGRFGRAAAWAKKAHDVKKSLNDHVGEIVSLYLLARAEGGRGGYDAALDALETGRLLSEETHNPFGLAQYPNTRAWLSAELGDWEAAYKLDRAGLELARAAPVRPPEISTWINLALDCTALGKLDEAEEYILAVQEWMGRPEFGFHSWRWQTRLADARARLCVAQARFVDAAQAVDDLLGWAACTQARKYQARGLLLRGQVHLARHDLPAAKADFVTARDLADLMCYRPIQIEARRWLRHVHGQVGDQDTAGRLQAEAAELVAETGRRLRHPDLRCSFAAGLARDVNLPL
ncbi:MAG: tetratricopeptide repeat protein [Anaerolineae bacterium]|nr:tetratricopeptide repeat protein [Anaerolineae bacterium]